MVDSVATYRAVERQYLAHFGLRAVEEMVHLDDPPVSVRITTIGDGQPVLFVPGGMMPGTLFAPLLAETSELQAVLIDFPGCGLSDPFDYRNVSLRSLGAGVLSAVMDRLGLDRCPIVANSMGGLWALSFAAARPERVSGLALFGCPAFILGTSAPGPMRLFSVPGVNRLLFRLEPPNRKNGRKLMARMGEGPAGERWTDVEIDWFVAAQRLPNYATAWCSMFEANMRLSGAVPRVGFSADELSQVRQPTSLVWGKRDPFGGPDVGRAVTDAMPQASLRVVDAGHLPWLDAAEACRAAVADALAVAGAEQRGSLVAV